MIIRLTVGDNDFSERITPFFKDFWMRMLELHPDNCFTVNESYEELSAWRQREAKVRSIMNPNNEHVLTDEEKSFVKEHVTKIFGEFVDRWFSKEDATYLKNNLSVELVDYCVDKWENGEVFYWFQHSNQAICQ